MTSNRVIEVLRGDDPLIAVVGAGDDLAKYGAIIYRHLKAKGYRVAAVNPNRATVDGDPSYPTLADLPERPDIVDFVVPPARTREVLETAAALDMRTVWVQPGAESPAVERFLEENGFDFVVDACIMVAAPRRVPAAEGRDSR